MRLWTWLSHILWFSLAAHAAQTTVSFDTLLPAPDLEKHDASAIIAGVTFHNTYNTNFYSWAGFAFSTIHNTTNGTWNNQYAAAQFFPRAYAIAYYDSEGWDPPPRITFEIPIAPRSVRVNLTTYSAHTIRNGDGYGFCPAFTNGDTYLLHLTATDISGKTLGTLTHPLADFRAGKTLIQTNWTILDLTALGNTVAAIEASITTTQPNAPTYFALADFSFAYSGPESGIPLTNSDILCWANGIHDYRPGSNVTGTFLNPTNALGPADPPDLGQNGSTNVVSLGDGGSITLTFPFPISDGDGPDFAIYENAFSTDFLELAFIEVSSDGTTFARFPTHTLATNLVEGYGNLDPMEPDAYGGLAGKHLQGYGTPFDLRELAEHPGLDTRRITHVRVVDIKGSGTTLDTYGNPIYDPTPTHGSGGFDLDGIAALHLYIEISSDPTAPPPSLLGHTTLLEYTPSLAPATWRTTAIPPRAAPGFFRWKLVREISP